ncbi:MAG: ArnT family glycosyltransferase [Candidatus Brocadiia bacterium]
MVSTAPSPPPAGSRQGNGGRHAEQWLAAILLVALAVRVAAVVAFHSLPRLTIGEHTVSSPGERPLFPDALEYEAMARNIRRGRGLVVSESSRIARMPGYPCFLAAVHAAFGEGLLAVRLTQAVLGVATAGLAYLFARRLFGPGEGLVAAAAAAVYPIFVLLVVLVLSEVLFAALLAGGMVCLGKAASSRRLVWALGTGAVLGAATLVRASLLLFVPLAAVCWVVGSRLDRRALRGAVLMVAVFAAMLAPWGVRNWWASGGHIVVTTLRAGASLYEALNPQADGGPMMESIDWGRASRELEARGVEPTEYARDRFWRRLAVRYAARRPGRVGELALRKLRRFWSPVPNEPALRTRLLCLLLGVPYGIAVVLAVVGLGASWRRGDVLLILVLPVVYHSLLHMVFVSSIRYRVVVMPLVLGLSAHGAVAVWGLVRRWCGRAAADRDRPRAQ